LLQQGLTALQLEMVEQVQLPRHTQQGCRDQRLRLEQSQRHLEGLVEVETMQLRLLEDPIPVSSQAERLHNTMAEEVVELEDREFQVPQQEQEEGVSHTIQESFVKLEEVEVAETKQPQLHRLEHLVEGTVASIHSQVRMVEMAVSILAEEVVAVAQETRTTCKVKVAMAAPASSSSRTRSLRSHQRGLSRGRLGRFFQRPHPF
jgi:hypothetical protein